MNVTRPAIRPFSMRALLFLGLLQLAGNLASIPLLQATNTPAEPIAAWVIWTFLSFVLIAIGLNLGRQTGLGRLFWRAGFPGRSAAIGRDA